MTKRIRRKGRSDETTTPYKRVRLKRTYKNKRRFTRVILSTAPVWIEVFYRDKWRKVKKCSNENEAIDVLVDIAEKMRDDLIMKKFRKYNWPDNPEDIREYDDEVLKKLWRYAPIAKTKTEVECSIVLADELVSRGLK